MNGKNLVFPIVIICVSAVFLFFASQFPSPSFQDSSVSSKFFPSAIAVIQIIICLCLIAGELLKRNKASESASVFSKYSIFGAAFIIGYAFLIYLLGYLASTLIAFFVYLAFFRNKNIWYYVTGIVFTCVIYYVFVNVFYVALPEGLITGLIYD